MTGYFITFEGGEGAGKSTQGKLLREMLLEQGYDVLLTREPGGTRGAEALRELLLFGCCGFSLRAEIMAHFTARCDHVDQVIKPALQANRIVICDRYNDSTLAYQGYGWGKGDPEIIQFIKRLSGLVGLWPDLTLVFNGTWNVMKKRCRERKRLINQKTDHYEQQGDAFHERILDGFQVIGLENDARCHFINADRSMTEVQQIIKKQVLLKLSENYIR